MCMLTGRMIVDVDLGDDCSRSLSYVVRRCHHDDVLWCCNFCGQLLIVAVDGIYGLWFFVSGSLPVVFIRQTSAFVTYE